MAGAETFDVDPLTRLAIRHGTDKWGAHFYTPLYHSLLAHRRDRPIRLLEIGIGGFNLRTAGGASLAMWAEYFAAGEITGLDIEEKRLALHPRVRLYRGAQDDVVLLKKISEERGPFDIVIDDGSHVPKHVVASFNTIFPLLADGGIYIIEDVQTAFWPSFGGSIMRGGDTVKLVRTLVECLNHAEIAIVDRSHSFPSFARQVKALRAFHNVLVVDKGDNDEPSNFAFDLANRHVAAALQTIEREMENTPTADGMANLIDLYVRGGDIAKAKQAASTALSLWPASATVLMSAYGIAVRQQDVTAKIDYLQRILEIEPDNASIRRAMEQLTAASSPSADRGRSPGERP